MIYHDHMAASNRAQTLSRRTHDVWFVIAPADNHFEVVHSANPRLRGISDTLIVSAFDCGEYAGNPRTGEIGNSYPHGGICPDHW
jgi:hypothetical protein